MDALQRALNIGRSVNFDCTVTIDQLVNVPLLNGRFKIKWKFANPLSGVHIDAHLKTKHVASSFSHRLVLTDDEARQGGQQAPSGLPAAFPHKSDAADSIRRLPRRSLGDSPPLSGQINDARSTYSRRSLMRDRELSGTQTDPIAPNRPLTQFSARTQFVRGSAASRSSLTGFEDPHMAQPASPRLGQLGDSTSSSQLIELPMRPESSGSTSYVEVRNHAVVFRQAFHCPVSINLDKDGRLQTSPLTMVVKEEHTTEQGRREVTRHGVLNIDLSQYAPLTTTGDASLFRVDPAEGEEPQSRVEKAKFLLRESKTNASLKVQIQMDYIGGAPAFKTPTNAAGASTESSTRLMANQEDSRSVYSQHRSATGSPGSSVLSSGSSRMKASQNAHLRMTAKPTALHPSQAHRPGLAPVHQRDGTLHVADDVINLLFSSTYVPSSGPLSQRIQSARSVKGHARRSAGHANQRAGAQDTLAVNKASKSSAEGLDDPQDKGCSKSIRSLRPKLGLFNRSDSQLFGKS